ncbi:RNA polymerase II transcription factor B subunit 2 [Quillaja saponaria]|uniref:RNA polymerase II transcription factor B subunit 2 n=1 Tax=Quillaja saponaria TaxID=32244 RepID=A0AAD7KW38_QUISA|nr:RNA polymerase II transcription factor B subunit 2 [Quillaja saponaria]
MYRINQTFQKNLQKLLVHGEVLPRESMPPNTVRLPSLEDLEAYAPAQWERGLLTQREKEAAKLTESGFQFLLMDTNDQLWYIIRDYISNSNSKKRGVDSADLISVLLELSFHITGEAYNIITLNDVQRSTIKDLADLGLVKLQQGRKESWFIPTKLVTNLSASLTDSSSRKQGFVVVETNFQMYAYSSLKLLCEILQQFGTKEIVVIVVYAYKWILNLSKRSYAKF